MQKKIILFASLILAMLYTATLYAAYNSLGANIRNGNSTEFSLWNPDNKDITVTYIDSKGNKTTVPLTKYSSDELSNLNSNYPGINPYTDIYGVTVSQNLNNCEYYFTVGGVQVRDPYAKMMAGVNETYQDVQTPPTPADAPMRNCVVIDTSTIEYTFSPRPALKNFTDSIIYEINVANFTSNPNSGIENPGTFTGMTQSSTCNGQSTGLQHLVDLGVTHVQIMPMFSFSYAGYSYNWGYNPLNYNVPQQRYSAYQASEYQKRINEVQEMVDKYHQNGIRVIMDVVYNHMYQGNYESATPSSYPPYFNITPSYYLLNSNGQPNGTYTGCGNTVDTSNLMVSNMVCDSLDWWMGNYNLDGFRFDLMATYPYPAVSQWVQYLNNKYPGRNSLFYGEPWPGDFNGEFAFSNSISYGTIPCTEYINDNDTLVYGAGCFNGNFRNDFQAYMLNNNYNIGNINTGFLASLRANQYLVTNQVPGDWLTWSYPYTNMPAETINYVSCHDGYTLWDLIANTENSNSFSSTNQYYKQADMFAIGMVMTSQGVAFIQEGDEFLRSKYANCDNWDTASNSYNAPLTVNQLDWSLKAQNINTFNYYKKLIDMRKNTPAFTIPSGSDIYSSVQTFYNNKTPGDSTQTGVLVAKIGYNGNNYIVIYNSGSDYSYYLTSGSWEVLTSIADVIPGISGYPAAGTVLSAGSSVICCGTSVTVLKSTSN